MSKQIYAKEYEEYLITGKDDSLNSLLEGSIEKEYISLIKKLLNEAEKTEEPKFQKELEEFYKRIPENQTYRLKALNIFKQLKNSPEKKDQIIDEIKKLFKLGNVRNYNKPIKYNKSSAETENVEDAKKLSNSLNISNYVFTDKFINDIYTNAIDPTDEEYNKRFFGSDVDLNLDFNKIPEKILINAFTKTKKYSKLLLHVLKIITFAKTDIFKNVFKSVIEECIKEKEVKKNFEEILSVYLHSFLNEQIEFLLSVNSNYSYDLLVYELIRRKYSEETEDKSLKVKILKEIKTLLDKYNYKDELMSRKVLLSLMKYNSDLNIYDIELFFDYLKCPLLNDKRKYLFNEEIEKKIISNQRQQNCFNCQVINENKNEETKIVENQLKHYYLVDKVPYEKFNKYFNENYLKKFYSKMQFYSGNETPIQNDILSNTEINELMKEIKLNINENNKEKFDINEDIELSLEIKNIQNLYVKIYEINTENYYYNNNTKFDTNISLDGIVPTSENLFTYDDKPQLLLEKKLKINLPKKRGLFIVELIGNGYVSRAVIQRGNLKYIQKKTYNGLEIFILDEDNNICKGDNTGMWINNQWFPAKKDNGCVLIPYIINANKTIIKHNDFCVLVENFYIPDEKYELNGFFIINEESFIMGNTTTILVRPYLYICDELCELNKLKNIKLVINSITKENNQEIPTVTTRDIKEFSYDKEFSFEYQVPSKLVSVSFEINAEIQPKTKDEVEKLSFNQFYYFGRINGYDALIKQNNNGNYIINLVGKNGEPIENHQISLNLFHKEQFNINKNVPILMESDCEGKIDLGVLKNINNIMLDNKNINIEQKSKYTYLPLITILENQKLSFPVSNDKNYLLKITQYQEKLENLTEKLLFEVTDKKNNLCRLYLPELTEGNYLLYLDNKNIEIVVIKGKELALNGYIETEKGEIRYNKNINTPIAVENIIYENKELKIKLNKNGNDSNAPHLHINFIQYRPKQTDKDLLSFQTSSFYSYIQNQENIIFNFNKIKNTYLNNKILSDEIQYVLDRKQFSSNLGNSLSKPSLLVKPQYIRDTTTEIQKGKEGKQFEPPRAFAGRFGGFGGINACKKCCNDFSRGKENIIIHDFINVSPLIMTNLIPDENGNIIIKNLDLDDYSYLDVIGFDKNSCYQDCFYLKNGKTKLRDLRAVNDMDLNKNYCEFRKIYPLSKNEKYKINDITSVQYKVFDSLEKYVKFIKILNPSLDKDLSEFEFLLNFENLKLPEKLDKVTKYFSHETNIYLYFHQNNFFNQYIFPILKYKSEKTFIDYFLLEDKAKILEYSQPQNVDNLNTFEKCLLIYSIREENPTLAKSIARQIRSECPKENQNDLKRLFNIALKLKSIEEEKEEEAVHFETANARMFCAMPMSLGACRPQMMMCKKMAVMDTMCFAEPECECCDEMGVDEDFAEKINIKARLFKEEGKSKEYCETHYYNKVYKNTNNKNIINPNNFFADLAQFWSNGNVNKNIGFKTDNILTNPKNFTEAIFMLSVLDLESKTLNNVYNLVKDQGLGVTVEANSNIYLLTKEINETELNTDNKYAVILAQMVFEDNENEKDKEKEPVKFLTNRTYILKTIITNISSKKINCEILMQIPEGSLPIDSEEYSIIETANIDSYKSQIFTQKFYFPQTGNYKQYPGSASINDLVIAKSALKTYEVVSNIKLNKEEIKSIDDVLNQGNKNEILDFIKRNDDIKRTDLEKIYWMLKDEDFYKNLIEILKNKYIFDDNIWEYSLNNKDMSSIQEYLINKGYKDILSKIGNELDLIFIKLDKTNNSHIMNHLDYYPILNSRVFKLPKAESILTVELRNTYQNYISYLITLPKINDKEYMRFCYYLILQQRINEATTVYNKINKNNIIGNGLVSLELQYDYLTAYLDFCNGYPKFEKAREICKKYKNLDAVKTWKNMFDEIEDQLNEYDGKLNLDEMIQKDDSKKNKLKAESEEILSIDIKDHNINIIYKNISEITVKYYLIDLEILFSRTPFIKKTKVDFNFINPQKTETIKVENETKENNYLLTIPDDLKSKNFSIEVSSGKIKTYEIYYSSLLKYSVIESIGEIKVMTPELKPLPKVYVKCFCEDNNGNVKFYKDGFTDLRGKFDYISLNNDLISNVKKFSILMVSNEYGSLIKICNPPKIIKEGKDSLEAIINLRQQLRKNAKK